MALRISLTLRLKPVDYNYMESYLISASKADLLQLTKALSPEARVQLYITHCAQIYAVYAAGLLNRPSQQEFRLASLGRKPCSLVNQVKPPSCSSK